MTREELLDALAQTRNEVGAYLLALSPADFVDGSAERWSPAHVADHLIRSNAPVVRGLGARDRLPTRNPAGSSRSYADLQTAYRAALAGGAKASGRFLPEPVGDQTALVTRYESTLSDLIRALDDWSEADLDAYAMLHPVLGELSVREMLQFTLLHNRHHLDGVRAVPGEAAPPEQSEP
ncbi:DinB family protein [Deinococcus koreensis]|uniref:DinB-like domain-containing protein n=1 Tax=Deinococcus koreensis TaxID=2054903 RepID=A0A2K3UX34_9DEIO|nr:DinB family protein [Deinococcus koreensis]PNY81097.1 hypothetical protein CVO96_06650 [Deinococcus koreensis]